MPAKAPNKASLLYSVISGSLSSSKGVLVIGAGTAMGEGTEAGAMGVGTMGVGTMGVGTMGVGAIVEVGAMTVGEIVPELSPSSSSPSFIWDMFSHRTRLSRSTWSGMGCMLAST